MVHYIGLYPNRYEQEMNPDILLGEQDTPIETFIIMAMKEFEAIENIKIEAIQVVSEQDQVDINRHMINVNYKKKNVDEIPVPQYKYIAESRYGEIIFKIRITTNLSEKVITKPILFPIKHEGFFYNGGKRMKAIWQLVDGSTYSQRGKSTLKSRMPIIIYQNRKRVMTDHEGISHIAPSYSYALNSRPKKPGAKTKTKFINPIMIYSAKMGFSNTTDFFGMTGIVRLVDGFDKDTDRFYYFPLNDIFIKVDKTIYDKYEMVRSFCCMCYNLSSKDFPVTLADLDNTEYWTCRIGTVGAIKNKSLASFFEKGLTTMYMIERLLDNVTIMNLRLPEYYKHNIYYLMYWMITNFDELRQKSNIDMANKRIRMNEYIVNSSLGKKINENINRLIEKRGKSRMNTMDTLLELFNFGSDIIIAGMRNLNDLIKSDDVVNDNDFILDIAFSSKGPNSLGEGNNKKIATKYRFLHPSMAGILDLNTSSNSDVGLSGSFTPFVKLYDRFYFTPDPEPCNARFLFEKALAEDGIRPKMDIDFTTYVNRLTKNDKFKDLLAYTPILIVEKEMPSSSNDSPEYASTEVYFKGDASEEGNADDAT